MTALEKHILTALAQAEYPLDLRSLRSLLSEYPEAVVRTVLELLALRGYVQELVAERTPMMWTPTLRGYEVAGVQP